MLEGRTYVGSEFPAPNADTLEYCQRSFKTALGGGFRLLRLTVPAPIAPLLAFPEGSMLWCPPTGPQIVGAGEIASVTGQGDERIEEIKQAAKALWQELCDLPHPDAAHLPPRLFGGLSFLTKEPSDEWSSFGQSKFWLPRSLYGKIGAGTQQRAFLSVCCEVSESPERLAEQIHSELLRLTQRSPSAPIQAQIAKTQHLSKEIWNDRIESIRRDIGSGGVHKVVAARQSRLHFREAIELRPALEKLSERYPDCYRFAFAQGDSTFVGASPETLIDKAGMQVTTQALAGSIAADSTNAGATLLASKKDRFEQDLVVRAIAAALVPLCCELSYSKIPDTRTLRHLTHLCTPIRGQLSGEKHVLDLVQALHPTPAVGGVPTAHAQDWIRNNESDRGWYAAPVGWFDAQGDGHFAVAIRSALFKGAEALVFAGAGIVGDSDPTLEYLETGLKQRAILDALGIL